MEASPEHAENAPATMTFVSGATITETVRAGAMTSRVRSALYSTPSIEANAWFPSPTWNAPRLRHPANASSANVVMLSGSAATGRLPSGHTSNSASSLSNSMPSCEANSSLRSPISMRRSAAQPLKASLPSVSSESGRTMDSISPHSLNASSAMAVTRYSSEPLTTVAATITSPFGSAPSTLPATVAVPPSRFTT